MSRIRITSSVIAMSALVAIGTVGAPMAFAAPGVHGGSDSSAMPPLVAPKIIWTLALYGTPVVKTVVGTGSEVGAETLFAAKLHDAKGNPMGSVEGVVITSDMLAGPGESVLRHRSQTYMLPGGEIEAEGSSYYAVTQDQMLVNHPTTVPIVGGTGKYIGASGEITITHYADGSYRHFIKLVRS
jgi:hypothetical protein